MNIFYREAGGNWVYLCCCREKHVSFWIEHDKKTHSWLEREYTFTRGRFPQ